MRPRWLLTARQRGDHAAEQARCFQCLQPDVEILRRYDAAMAKHTTSQFIISGMCFEHEVCRSVTELVRRDFQTELLPEPF